MAKYWQEIVLALHFKTKNNLEDCILKGQIQNYNQLILKYHLLELSSRLIRTDVTFTFWRAFLIWHDLHVIIYFLSIPWKKDR